MSRVAKKEEVVPVTAGIRGVLRKYLCEMMLDKVPTQYKILIMDEEALAIINSCFKMHDVMEHGITLVVPLGKPRQPVKSCKAIYFVAPTQQNMLLIVKDWQGGKEMYNEGPNLFITTSLSDQILGHLAGTDASSKCKTLVDLHIEFHAPEQLFFNLRLPMDFPCLYGSTYSPVKVSEIGTKIASALLVAGERPCIRCYNNDLCKSLATRVKQTLEAQEATGADTSGLLIIVDRAIDLAAALVHEFTYEAFINDNCPIPNNQLEVKTESETKKVLIDMDDDVWCAMRHKHLAQLGTEIDARVKLLGDRFPKLMEFSKTKGGASTKDLGDAIRDLPAFNIMKQNISTHQFLVSKVMKTNADLKLQQLGEFEQQILVGVSETGSKIGTKEALKIIADVLKSNDFDATAKKRIAMLGVIALGPSAVDDIVKLKPQDKSCLEALGRLFDIGAKDKTSRNKKSDSEYFVSSYKGYVKSIMEQAVLGTLDSNTFPVISGDPGGALAGASAADQAAPARGGGLFKKATTASGSSAKSAPTKLAANLDLGHGTLLPLTSKARIWIFIAGGATRSEIRAAYEVAAQQKREIIVGATSVISPSSFVSTLEAMN